ncbi:MAG: tail fiber domain-containing protein, partial [Clostridiaceae bacterium]|nr:tail fiber domain-containing protein [Clostridiaceae bacterium]
NNVLKLKPCKYDYDFSSSNSPHLQNIKPDEYSNQFGFIAQELMEIYPNLVKEDTTTNLLSIDYEGLIPVLTMAIQELDQKILDLEQKLSNVSTNKSSDIDNTSKSDVTLGKNKPNPFRENTMIEYYIPVEVSNASFIIYDMQGKQLKSMKITERGNGFVTIQGNELRPGIYNYSLIVDGEVVGVERMILTD